MAEALTREIQAEIGAITVRRFPDSESYVRFDTPVAGRSVVLICTLDRPDDKFLPLLFAAAAARDLQAARVGVIAPYLAYMRQDKRFQPGEAITSNDFGRMLSERIDWLVTVDPHLHRHASLGEIYSIPTRIAHSAPLISAWIRGNVDQPLLIGPDSESKQWVAAVARNAGAPYLVLHKTRHGDRDVEVSIPEVERYRGHTPVLVDDIISTAHTMIEPISHLRRQGMPPPVCIAVHGVFAGTAYDDLLQAGAARVITSNTIPHPSNQIDVCGLIASSILPLAS
jgi:ribose-phosphate pyrophosphokinase